MQEVVLIGAGGHAKVVLATLLAAGYRVKGIYDDDPQTHGKRLLGIAVLGPTTDPDGETPAVLGIGNNETRLQIADRCSHLEWMTAVHPLSHVHPSVQLGPGTVVFAGAVIQPDTIVGKHSIINTGSTVDHDCTIGNFVHLAPGTHLAGNIRVGDGAFLGIGTVAIPGITVGSWSVTGAGSVLIQSIEERIVVAGIPARPIREKKP